MTYYEAPVLKMRPWLKPGECQTVASCDSSAFKMQLMLSSALWFRRLARNDKRLGWKLAARPGSLLFQTGLLDMPGC